MVKYIESGEVRLSADESQVSCWSLLENSKEFKPSCDGDWLMDHLRPKVREDKPELLGHHG